MKKQQKRFFAFLLSMLLIAGCVVGDLGSVCVVRAEEPVAVTVSANETEATVSENVADVTVSGSEAEAVVEAEATVSENEAEATVSENEAETIVCENETEPSETLEPVSLAAAAEMKSVSLNMTIAYAEGKRYEMGDGSELADGAEASVAEFTAAHGVELRSTGVTAKDHDGTEVKEYGEIPYIRLNKGSKLDGLGSDGRYVSITPKYDGELFLAAKVDGGKTFTVSTLDGGTEAAAFSWKNETGANQQTYFDGIKVEAGKTYYIYNAGGGTDWYEITYSYEEKKQVEYEEKTVSLPMNIAYAEGKSYELADGSELASAADASVAAFTAAHGVELRSTGVTAIDHDGTEVKEYGEISYIRLNKGSKLDGLGSDGRYVSITPKYDGELFLAAKVDGGKTFTVSTLDSGTEAAAFSWKNETGANQQTYFDGIKVEAGKTYYIYNAGGGTDWYEISFTYMAEKEAESETPELPEIDLVEGVLAFPTAEGGGRNATGGRGGDVYVVTSLEDYAKGESAIEGTLRYAIDTAPADGRIIVFNVGGTINLQQKLNLKNNITLMGQTAPGEGITIAGFDTGISNLNNLIIRYMHFRVGDDQLLNGGDSFDALWGRDMDTFIIDHCSFSWNTDECLSTYRGQNGTVQWCIISESLTVSGHSKGRHGYGGIFGSDNTVFQYNLIADHTSRNPRMGGGVMGDGNVPATVQVSNNVIYNWGFNNCYGGGNTFTNYINNYHRPGQGTRDFVRNQLINPGSNVEAELAGTGFYIAGNYLEGSNNPVINWAGPNEATTAFKSEAFDNITLRSATEAYGLVLNSAGVTYPKRDAIDARVIQSVIDDTGIFVNNEDEVGDYCAPSVSREADFDTDMDGIPNAWETAHGLNPNDNSDSRNLDPATGYAWVEVYCHELVNETSKVTYVAPNPVANMDLVTNTQIKEGESVTVTVSAEAKNGGSIAKVEFYNGKELVGTDTEAPFTHTYSGLADGTYNISARAYDNDDNATQTAPAKLHVNSTAGTGEWTVTDIGDPGHKSAASLIEGVLTVKGAGKIGKSEGSDSAYDKANGTHYTDASRDDFAYVYKKFTGDMEIVTNLNSYIAADIHSYNGLMFRESLDTDSAAVGLGFGMSKQVDETTIWNAYMVKREKNGGSMTEIGSALDSSADAAKKGIPFVYGLNFKDGLDYTGMWLKLKRTGDTFSGYVSEDGLTWKTVGSYTVDLPDEVYVGFAVDAGKVANEINNYVTAKFSDIKINTEFATIEYDVTKLEVDGVKSIAVGEDVVITLSAGTGYVLPETVEVTKNGVATEFTYDKEAGTILITKAEGAYVVKAEGVKRQIVKASLTEVDPDNLLTVEEKDGVLILTQTATEGSVANHTVNDPAVNQSYVLFPKVEDSHSMTMKIKVTNLIATSKPGVTGVYIGKFNLDENAFTTIAFRTNALDGAADALCGYWTKDATRSGNGNPKAAYELNKEYLVTYLPDGQGGHTATVYDAATNTKIMDKRFKMGECYIKSDTEVQYGIGLIGATVEVSEITLVDHEGNNIYPGEGLPEAGTTVEEAVENILADETTTAEEKMALITSQADGDDLVALMAADSKVAADVTAVVAEIVNNAAAASNSNDAAMAAILASVDAKVLAEARKLDAALDAKITELTAKPDTGNGSGNDSGSSEDTDNSSQSSTPATAPKTGDKTPVGVMLAMLMLALGTTVLAFKKRVQE